MPVSEDAPVGRTVGVISATDPDDGDTLTYSITAGNEDSKFSIDTGTGRIRVAGALDRAADPTYRLTVEADDGNGGLATVTVNIAVAVASCSGGVAVSESGSNPGLVSDCETLLGLKGELAGTATTELERRRSYDELGRRDGTGGTPSRVTGLALQRPRSYGERPASTG